jgi:hypothetical protein
MAYEYDARLKLYSGVSHPLSEICDHVIEVIVPAEYTGFVRVYEDAGISERVVLDKEVRPIGAFVIRPTFVAVGENPMNEDDGAIARALIEALQSEPHLSSSIIWQAGLLGPGFGSMGPRAAK